jgi:hypothetical protein
MKKFLSVLMVICIALPIGIFGSALSVSAEEGGIAIWDGTVAKSFASGTGTSDDPYIIETAGQLAYLSKTVTIDGMTFSGKYVKLANDIYLNDTSDWKSWSTTAPANAWTPIGTAEKPFKGSFNGNDKTIYGIYVNDVEYAGLFGYGYSSYIHDINIMKSYIQSNSAGYAGGVIGYIQGYKSSLVLADSRNYATVSGNYAGGICGRSVSARITACSNLGDVIGIGANSYAGGIVGTSSACDVSECFNGGSIAGNISGGIAGYFYTSFSTTYSCNAMGYCSHPLKDISNTLTNCYNYGEIRSQKYSGGIVGECSIPNSSIDFVEIGKRCVQFVYNVGIVESDGSSGQLIGNAVHSTQKIFMNKSYYYNPVASIQYAFGGTSSDSNYATSLSNEKAMLQKSYSNFDFESVWTMDGNEKYMYPELRVHPHVNQHEHSYTSKITTEPTHLAEGVTTYTCECGDTYEEAIAKTTEHTYTSEITTEPTHLTEGVETFTCECGDTYTEAVAKTTEHTYTSEITTQPTHKAEGVETFTCECGDTYTKPVAMIAHVYNKAVTAPTCTENGYTTYTCECGETYKGDSVNKTGHSHTSVVTRPATHLVEGIRTYTCTVCSHSYTESIAKTTDHSYAVSKVVAPTCEGKGYTVYICECGDSYEGDKKAATGHSYDGDNCRVCGESKVENCTCKCHKGGIAGFFWKIGNFFNKLFKVKSKKICACGVAHY